MIEAKSRRPERQRQVMHDYAELREQVLLRRDRRDAETDLSPFFSHEAATDSHDEQNSERGKEARMEPPSFCKRLFPR
jgi:hypothetical protein